MLIGVYDFYGRHFQHVLQLCHDYLPEGGVKSVLIVNVSNLSTKTWLQDDLMWDETAGSYIE